MSDVSLDGKNTIAGSREELMEALFADLVGRQTNLALMFLGKVKNPEIGQPTVDLEAAQMFIDQLEMLETKTRGNLSRHEERFLKEGLMHLRLAFVQASEAEAQAAPAEPAVAGQAPASSPAAEEALEGQSNASPVDDEEKVRFSKKY